MTYIQPIKKIVDIIQRLAEGPLKRPELPKINSDLEKTMKMKTKMDVGMNLTQYLQ